VPGEVKIPKKPRVIRSPALWWDCPDVGQKPRAMRGLVRSFCLPETGAALFTAPSMADAWA
jgi:hypothetical protein